MLRLAVAVLAVALAGTAGAAGWRDLKIDGSNEAAFQQSLGVFQEKLSRERQHVFLAALTDIWLQGTADAKADQREFTVSDYYRQLDGLSYDDVVTFTDPTGKTAEQRYQDAKRMNVANSPPASPSPGTQKQRALGAHEALHGAELMKGRSGDSSVTPRGQPGLQGIPGQQ